MLYAREMFAYLDQCPDLEVHAVASEAGEQVLHLELGLELSELVGSRTIVHGWKNFAAPLASGSFQARGMVVIPCTMGSLGAIAQGLSRNLIHRAVEVMLKEKRPLILVVRETPLGLVHLKKMPGRGGSRRYHLSGHARVLPPAPEPDGDGPEFCGPYPGSFGPGT